MYIYIYIYIYIYNYIYTCIMIICVYIYMRSYILKRQRKKHSDARVPCGNVGAKLLELKMKLQDWTDYLEIYEISRRLSKFAKEPKK